MDTGSINPLVVDGKLSFTQNSMFSPLVFDSVNNKFCLPQLKTSSSFGIVDYFAHENAEEIQSLSYAFN